MSALAYKAQRYLIINIKLVVGNEHIFEKILDRNFPFLITKLIFEIPILALKMQIKMNFLNH
jgi:hypothetical protein